MTSRLKLQFLMRITPLTQLQPGRTGLELLKRRVPPFLLCATMRNHTDKVHRSDQNK